MTLGHVALVLGSGFVNVFLLGFQSRNAVAGRYRLCACTSFMIAACQVIGWHAAATDDPWIVALLIGISGSAGICTAIFVNLNLAGLNRV